MENKKETVKKIFDDIAFKYDFLNHLLSFGLDFYWRKKALSITGVNKHSIVLDVACGTGDFSIAARKMGVKSIFGADFSGNMLNEFNKKAPWIVGKNFQSVAELLPLKDTVFTNILVAFGVRNFYNIADGFRNFYRVLQEGGKVTILEFKMPKNRLVRGGYNLYFKYFLPLIGGLFSKSYKAYKYLPDSVMEFDEKVDLVRELKDAGFSTVENHKLTFGVVYITIAIKGNK